MDRAVAILAPNLMSAPMQHGADMSQTMLACSFSWCVLQCISHIAMKHLTSVCVLLLLHVSVCCWCCLCMCMCVCMPSTDRNCCVCGHGTAAAPFGHQQTQRMISSHSHLEYPGGCLKCLAPGFCASNGDDTNNKQPSPQMAPCDGLILNGRLDRVFCKEWLPGFLFL